MKSFGKAMLIFMYRYCYNKKKKTELGSKVIKIDFT